MNSMFEDRLLAELRQVVAARPAPAAPHPTPHRGARPRLLAGGFAAAAVAAVAVVIAGGGGGASPAYAVERQSDGSVTVSINSLRDAAGLERKLRDAGIAADVRYLPNGKMCRVPPGKPAGGISSMGVSHTDGGATTFTVPRGEVKDGQKLLIQSSTGEGISSIGTAIVDAGAQCEVVGAPGIPASPGGGDTGPSLHTAGG